ncbi:dienelactone hydrolase family protein [Leptospira fainei serovar Hurstbridge str. BUT 6]|uniref:Dienelactone hydrolase family protein n=1 Tax=Leptospira fainei serovar Hurstbridge str. BUT 6 TaxID=1193011 RepID=S3V933_9LEPT|nr:dienelactone hydrolase family protein [Leptospira fainei]EPG72925.1 dienelactone hydrolase family protein [Leptospira fainei serovar Hurstbridge str. BUT 6]
MIIEQTRLSIDDRSIMHAFIAKPDQGPSPALILLQEVFGVNHHIKDVAQRFAREGFYTIAPELFHRTAPPGYEGNYEDFRAARPHFSAITIETLESDLNATYSWLLSRSDVKADSIGSVGYCLGGKVSFLANSLLPLQTAVSFYGGGIAPSLLSHCERQNGPILLVWAGLDKNILPEHYRSVSDSLRKHNKNYVEAIFSNANHGFFCDARSAYNTESAQQAWSLTVSFLKTYLMIS